MTTPASTAAAIVSAAQDKAAEISATGSYAAIQDGYRACSALVLEMALNASERACREQGDSRISYLNGVLNALNAAPRTDKQAILDQITDLLQQLVD